MMIINNEVVYSDEELANQAFQRYVEAGYEIEYYSFVEGYLTALKDMK
jgi:hypothetical protein